MTEQAAQSTPQIDVLLVEPSPGDARLFSESFEVAARASTLYTVADAESALEFVHGRGEFDDVPRPDLLLLEPNLPGSSGWDLIAELDDDPSVRDLPVVVLTGTNVEESIARSRDVEADHYVQKPAAPDEFERLVRSVAAIWLDTARPTTQ